MSSVPEAITETLVVNMGPQHPSTHGVLRVILELEGEVVRKATPIVGHLHRGVEKLSENRTYHQIIPIMDRMDYLAHFSTNLAYVLAVEKLSGDTDSYHRAYPHPEPPRVARHPRLGLRGHHPASLHL
jgi:NADH-quinone oxidoreductase subunit D